MFYCIQLFTNTCEVTMQVNRAIGKAILQNYQYEYVLVLSLYIILHDLLFVFQL